MTTAPVSVVIPFYNGHACIQRALTSIERQVLPPAEVIVVDDGSLEPLQLAAPVRVIRHEKNQGIPHARNTGIRAATQPWIAFLDQDDEWLPHKLAAQWEIIDRAGNDSSIVCYGAALRERAGHIVAWPRASLRARIDGPRALQTLLSRGNVVPLISILMSRKLLDALNGFDESLRGGSDDYDLVLRACARGARFIGVDGAVARRHEHGANFSNAEAFLADDRRVLERLDVSQSLKNGALSAACYRCARAIAPNDPARALRLCDEALTLAPAALRPRLLQASLALGRAFGPVHIAAERILARVDKAPPQR